MQNFEIIGKWKPFRARILLMPAMFMSVFGYTLFININENSIKYLSLLIVLPIIINIAYYIKIIKTPTINANGNNLTTCNEYGKKHNLSPIKEYSLINSVDFIGFRKEKMQDVTISKHIFNNEECEGLVLLLKKLPFLKVIEGTHG